MNAKIGVYICHCGSNIANKVNVKHVRDFISTAPNVTIARDYKFMCSDPGQELIVNDIGELKLNRVIVAACSPLMHEKTFQKTCERSGINRYLFQMANIREHCSWVHDDERAATEKAKAIINAAVRRIVYQEPLELKKIKINPATLIVGGGIAGIQAALEIAESGNEVYLVEKEASIGGKMAILDKTFPTLDCSACILTPKMVTVGQQENIHLLSYSEVIGLSGSIGDFTVKVLKKPRYIDENKCTGCGFCYEHCPAVRIPKYRVIKLGKQTIKEIKKTPLQEFLWKPTNEN